MKQMNEEKLRAYAAEVSQKLETYLAKNGEAYDEIKDAMAYSVSAGGKRIRPVLTLEFAKLFGGEEEHALPLACAVEMIHTYSLIHDDLPCMDDDDFRRGRPSCHKQFGEATALLAGDALLTLAFGTIAEAPQKTGADAGKCLRAAAILAQKAGMDGMIGGQVLDLANEGKPVNKEILTQTNALKTSALLQAACQMGAVIGGADETQIALAGEYAYELGLAFQIVDDILDVTGNAEELGKPIGSDAENQKTTFVSLLTLEGAKALAEECTVKALAALAKLPESDFLNDLTQYLLARRA